MTNETGGPAFPVPTGCGEEWGMTLRDYFAAHAVAGMCASFPNVIRDNLEEFVQRIPTTSYEIADAMLKARNSK